MITNKLEDVANIAIGLNIGNFTKKNNGLIKLLNLSDVQNGKLKQSCIYTYSPKSDKALDLEKLEKYRIKNQDILISNTGPTVKVCLVSDIDSDIYITSSFFRFRAKEDVLYPLFLKYYLDSPFGKFLLESRQLMSTTLMINSQSIATLPIHYIPYKEQVALVEKLVAQELTINDSINKLNNQLDGIKQSFHKEIGMSDFTYDKESVIEERKTSVIKRLKKTPDENSKTPKSHEKTHKNSVER